MTSTKVKFETSMGDILIEMLDEASPLTVANFVRYVRDGFYDGTVFHRIIPGFVVQGGGMLPGLVEKDTRPPVRNEAANREPNKRGTLSMARTSDPDSASSQFFINLADNKALDHGSPTPRGYGYCVFGKVVEGMETVDAMAKLSTGDRHPHQNVPLEDVLLKKASFVE
ncbi:MAG: peptidylprolyl isomerase [Spirochaetes bacterium]|nr:peptidylprolyl isomerase [Spirochaetota bacterium]